MESSAHAANDHNNTTVSSLPAAGHFHDFDEEQDVSMPSTFQSSSRSGVRADDEFITGTAEFLLMLTEGKQLSQAALEAVIKGCRRICEESVSQVKKEVLSVLSNSGLNSGDIPGLSTSFSAFSDPFEKLGTAYMLEKFYKEYFNYKVCYYTIL